MPLLNKFFFLKTDLPQFFEIEKKMCVCEVRGKNFTRKIRVHKLRFEQAFKKEIYI